MMMRPAFLTVSVCAATLSPEEKLADETATMLQAKSLVNISSGGCPEEDSGFFASWCQNTGVSDCDNDFFTVNDMPIKDFCCVTCVGGDGSDGGDGGDGGDAQTPMPTPQPTTTPPPAPSPIPPAPPAPPGKRTVTSKRELNHFKLVNKLRAKGFTCPDGTRFEPNPVPLVWHCRLFEASQWHSQDMAKKNYFSHTGQNPTTTFSQRAEARGTTANGENIAAGRAGAAAVLEQWKKSNGHCLNMMSPAFKSFAVGVHSKKGSEYTHYWTQMFSRVASGLDETSCLQTNLLQMNMTDTPLNLDLDDIIEAGKEIQHHDETKCPVGKPAKRGDDHPCMQHKCGKQLQLDAASFCNQCEADTDTKWCKGCCQEACR